jgi:transposase-like protein
VLGHTARFPPTLPIIYSEEEIRNIVIGSDEEIAFTVAIRRSFPGATHTLCIRHLRHNTDRYLEDEVGTENRTDQSS